MRDPETAEYAERARARGKSDREVMRCLKRYVAREAYRALMRPHEVRRPEDASGLVAARRAARVSQVRAASILGTSEKYISMLERGQRELKPIRRAYEAWVEAGLPLDWDRQAFEAERKMDSKNTLPNRSVSSREPFYSASTISSALPSVSLFGSFISVFLATVSVSPSSAGR